MIGSCESCLFYEYDELTQQYYCDADFDEDEYARHQMAMGALGRAGGKGGSAEQCPYYRDGDEYKTVRKQI